MFVFQGLSVPPCPQCRQRRAGAVGQTKLHHKQRYPSQNLGTQARRFQDKGDWSVDVRTKGEVKGGGTEKTERERQTEKERLHFEPTTWGCVFGHQAACFQKGPVKEGTSCPLPARVIKPGNQAVVHRLWDCTHRWDSHPQVHQYIEICHFSLFPTGLLPVAGKRWEDWDNHISSHYMIWDLNLWHSHKSPVRECLLDHSLPGVRHASPTTACHPWRWAIASQRDMESQAERSDAVAAWCPLYWKDKTDERTDKEVRYFRRGKGEWWRQRTKRKGRPLLEEGYWGPRDQEGRLTKRGDAETGVSGGCLSPMGKLCLVLQEVPRSPPQKGPSSMLGATKYVTDQNCWPP